MAYSKRITVDPIRTLAFGAVGAAFAAVGTAVDSPIRIFVIKNFTDASMDFSIDGVNEHFVLLPNSGQVMDLAANKVRDEGWFLREGTIFYVRQSAGAPTSGAIYIEVLRS